MNSSLETLNLASISGIVAATMLIIEVLKRIFSHYSWFGRVPVFVYAGVIATVLAFVANQIPTDEDSVLLEGNKWKLMWAALIAAMGASGFYSWLSNPEKLAMTKKLGKTAPFILLFLLVGCNCPEKAILREGMDGVTRTIRAHHKEVVDKLEVDPATGKNRASELKPLTPTQADQFRKAHEEYENLVAEDRARG